MRTALRAFLTTLVAVLPATAALAEWTSWRGPAQNGSSAETGLVATWSPEGQNLIWKAPFDGRSTPVVFDGRVCANGRAGEGIERREILACFDAGSGEKLWERDFPVYHNAIPFQRVGWASPAADRETGYVFIHAAGGQLAALARDGEIVWERQMTEEFGRLSGFGGRTQTPIVDGDLVILAIVTVGWGDEMAPPGFQRYYAFDKRSGELVWTTAPGSRRKNPTPYSTPVVAEIGGRRLLVGGDSDGSIHALDVASGESVWTFQLSKNSLHPSPVVAGDVVYAMHGEENVDDTTMGRVVAIDATGRGDVTATHELWRVTGIEAAYTSPAYHAGRLYLIDNSANLHALDAKSGEKLWSYSLGTVGKGSPVWADGKLYAPEVNGNFHILEAGETGARELDKKHLTVGGERYAELYGSPAIAYGRVYFTTDEGLYCLGDKSADFAAAVRAARPTAAAAPARGEGPPAVLRVVPAEAVGRAGETLTFSVRAFDARGRPLGGVPVEWSLEGIEGSVEAGRLATAAGSGTQAGAVVARWGEGGQLTARARVRVFSPLPWRQDFETVAPGGRPGWWLDPARFKVEEMEPAEGAEGGGRVLALPPAARGFPRAGTLIGDPRLSDYTIQADLMGTQEGRRRGDLGLINSGYTAELQGNYRRLYVYSWISEDRMAQKIDFDWDPGVWYTMKLQVDPGPESTAVRVRVWRRGDAEPADWTLTIDDPLRIQRGSPGLSGNATTPLYFDNLEIKAN